MLYKEIPPSTGRCTIKIARSYDCLIFICYTISMYTYTHMKKVGTHRTRDNNIRKCDVSLHWRRRSGGFGLLFGTWYRCYLHRWPFCFPWGVSRIGWRAQGPLQSPGVGRCFVFSPGATLVAHVCAGHPGLEGRGHEPYRPFREGRRDFCEQPLVSYRFIGGW